MSDLSAQLDHVCLAVRNLKSASAILERTLGYRPRTNPVENTRQQVIVQFMSKPGSLDIKLIQPSSIESPLTDFIKRSGGGLHHLAFKTNSVQDAITEIEGKGAKIVASPAPGEAFDDSLIAFAFLGAGLNVEFIESDARRDPIIHDDQGAQTDKN